MTSFSCIPFFLHGWVFRKLGIALNSRGEPFVEMMSDYVLILSCTLAFAQPCVAAGTGCDDFCPEEKLLQKIVLLSGAADLESLDSQTMERFGILYTRPLKINLAGRSRLLASGLFTPYQIAAFCDYRERNGDVLSIMELALVDGFGQEFALALEPFISLESPGLARRRHSVNGDFLVRASYTDKGFSEGLKTKVNWQDRIEAATALSTTSGQPFFPPEHRGFYLACYGKYHLDKIILGDFNARFGQGLGIWTGFSMRGFSSFTSFFHRPMGLSPSWSWSSSNLRGLAADFNFGRWVFSSALACPSLRTWMDGISPLKFGFLPLLNLAYYGRKGQYSVTSISALSSDQAYAGRLTADFRYDLNGTALFGETAWDIGNGKYAGVLGAVINLGPQIKISFLGRYYPAGFYNEYAAPASMSSKAEDEWGTALGADISGYVFTLDFADYPIRQSKGLKAYFSKTWNLRDDFILSIRLTDKWHPVEKENKADLRLDWKYTRRQFLSVIRTEATHARDFGILSYLEAGYRNEILSSYVRMTLFRADHWEDRIYSYERDAPGSFNVPAYYGRGLALSANYTHKFYLSRNCFRLYLRLGTIQYLGMDENKKPGKAELKFQLSYVF